MRVVVLMLALGGCSTVTEIDLTLQLVGQAATHGAAAQTLTVDVTGDSAAFHRDLDVHGKLTSGHATLAYLPGRSSGVLGFALQLRDAAGALIAQGQAQATIRAHGAQALTVQLGALDGDGGFVGDDGGFLDGDAAVAGDAASSPTGDGGPAPLDGAPPDLTPASTHDPATCAEAALLRSYIGCDYWPTVTFNPVWTVFDFVVVVSNPSATPANVTVTGGALASPAMAMVAPGSLAKIALPWVGALKGPQADSMGAPSASGNSVLQRHGAYHLVSDTPVLAYQFSPLEYKPGTGPDLNGIDWSTCPASGVACFSYTNDASLLLPSTAMTANYLVTGVPGADAKPLVGANMPISGSFLAVTAVTDNTSIVIQLSAHSQVVASGDGTITASTGAAKVSYTLNSGDVLELLGANGSTVDFTGAQIQAERPVQLLVGAPCTTNPRLSDGTDTCDHVEETVLPYETWGKRYVVTAPTGPNGDVPGHTVRLYGGPQASQLTVTPAVASVPATLAAGGLVELDTTQSFLVEGDQPFAVASIQKSAKIADPGNTGSNQRGDPSLSFLSAIEQYRDHYVFLAPNDYSASYADVAVPMGTTLLLDGAVVATAATTIGGGYGVVRLMLATTGSGAHRLSASVPFGVQVIGYGSYTSYQYPGGLDLKQLAPPPPPIP